MKFEELRKDNIIFSYQTGPTYGAEGADGGFSVTLYGNGNLRYCTYKLMDQISSMQIFKLSKGQTKMVYDVVAPFADELREFRQNWIMVRSEESFRILCFWTGRSRQVIYKKRIVGCFVSADYPITRNTKRI